jgi:hypothetical protein
LQKNLTVTFWHVNIIMAKEVIKVTVNKDNTLIHV